MKSLEENLPLSWFERSSFNTIRTKTLPGDSTPHAFLCRHCRFHGISISGGESSLDMACLLMRRAAVEADMAVMMQATEEEFGTSHPQTPMEESKLTRAAVAVSSRVEILNSKIQLCEAVRSSEVDAAQLRMEIQVDGLLLPFSKNSMSAHVSPGGKVMFHQGLTDALDSQDLRAQLHHAHREATDAAVASQQEIHGLWIQLFEASSLVEEAISLAIQDMGKPKAGFDQAIEIAEIAISQAVSSQTEADRIRDDLRGLGISESLNNDCVKVSAFEQVVRIFFIEVPFCINTNENLHSA